MSPTSVAVLQNEISHIKETVDRIEEMFRTHVQEEKEYRSQAMSLFALKWSEKFLASVIVIILTWVGGWAGVAVVNTIKNDAKTVSSK